MPIVFNDLNNEGFHIGIWELKEPESFFEPKVTLTANLQKLLQSAKTSKRRIEILSVRLLMKILGIDCDIAYTHSGKPTIKSGNISISHSNNYSAVIFHKDKNVGIDIEKISNILIKGQHLVFNNYEINFANYSVEILTILWCCKECIVKLINNKKTDFLTEIHIHPFDREGIIECDYIKGKATNRFYFHQFKMNNHIVVWGNDDLI